jgi:hypothetical protein
MSSDIITSPDVFGILLDPLAYITWVPSLCGVFVCGCVATLVRPGRTRNALSF